MPRTKKAALFLGGLLLFTCLFLFWRRDTDAADVVIDGAVEYQVMEGWGITHFLGWDWEGPGGRYPIPERDVMDQIRALGIDVIHGYYNAVGSDGIEDGWMEEENDDGDPFHYNWESYDRQFGYNAAEFARLKEIQDAGLQVVIKGGNRKPAWMVDANGDFDATVPKVYDEMGEYWAAFMIYAKQHYGLAIPYIVIQQEPSWERNCNFSPEEIREAIKAVGARLRQEGFSTRILAPDDENAEASREMCRVILADPEAAGYMPYIAFHGYDGASNVYGSDVAIPAFQALVGDDIVKSSGLPLYLTEWELRFDKRMRDYVDTLRLALGFAKMVYNSQVYANASGFVIWSSQYDWGYDKDGNGILENEGIFGPGVADGRLVLKKYGHALAQYTRYVPPGSRRIRAAVSGASNLFATAYKDAAGRAVTAVLINQGPDAVAVNVRIRNLSGVTALQGIRTSDTEDEAVLGTVSLAENAFPITVKGSSVTTYTGAASVQEGGAAGTPAPSEGPGAGEDEGSGTAPSPAAASGSGGGGGGGCGLAPVGSGTALEGLLWGILLVGSCRFAWKRRKGAAGKGRCPREAPRQGAARIR